MMRKTLLLGIIAMALAAPVTVASHYGYHGSHVEEYNYNCVHYYSGGCHGYHYWHPGWHGAYYGGYYGGAYYGYPGYGGYWGYHPYHYGWYYGHW